MSSLNTQIITETEGFRALREEWTDLLHSNSDSRIFVSWEWMYTWWLHLAGKRKLHIITVRQDDLLIAIAPLVLCPAQIRRLIAFPVLEFLGSGHVGSDYLSFLIRKGYEPQAQRELADSLTGSRRMLELVRISSTSPTMASMKTCFQSTGWQLASRTTNCSPYVKLSGLTWESYLDSLSPSHVKYFKRKVRKLNRDFSVEFEKCRSEQQRQQDMSMFVRLHLASWAKRGGSTALHQQKLVDFHQAFSSICLERGWLGLYTLKLNGTPAASIYLFKYGNVVSYYQMALNTDFSKYSVGLIILGESIRKAIEAGAEEFDLLHGNEAYKYRWAHDQRELVRFELYPPRVKGKVYHGFMLANSGAKRLIRNVNTFLQP